MPDDNYLVMRTPNQLCARCGQPFDWHDDEPPHAVRSHAYGDDCLDEGCEGYLEAEATRARRNRSPTAANAAKQGDAA